jgi:hypothetical protein
VARVLGGLELLTQPRLADPGLAVHEQQLPVAPPCVGERVTGRGQLGGPPDQRGPQWGAQHLEPPSYASDRRPERSTPRRPAALATPRPRSIDRRSLAPVTAPGWLNHPGRPLDGCRRTASRSLTTRVYECTSVSGLVARELEKLVAEDARYEEAWRRATEIMARSVPRGGRTWRRDELHER